MKFIHQREQLNEGDLLVIQSSQPCNIRLMNDANFRSFKNGARHNYIGGAFERFPARIPVPSTGRLEGEANYTCAGDGDCHLTVLETEGCELFEMWRANDVLGKVMYQSLNDVGGITWTAEETKFAQQLAKSLPK